MVKPKKQKERVVDKEKKKKIHTDIRTCFDKMEKREVQKTVGEDVVTINYTL